MKRENLDSAAVALACVIAVAALAMASITTVEVSRQQPVAISRAILAEALVADTNGVLISHADVVLENGASLTNAAALAGTAVQPAGLATARVAYATTSGSSDFATAAHEIYSALGHVVDNENGIDGSLGTAATNAASAFATAAQGALAATSVQPGSAATLSSLEVTNLTVVVEANIPGPLVVSSLVTTNLTAQNLYDAAGMNWTDRAVWRTATLGSHLYGANMTYTAASDGAEGLAIVETFRRTAGVDGSLVIRVPCHTYTTGVIARVSQVVSTNAIAATEQKIRMAAYAVDSLGAENLGAYGDYDTRTLAGGKEAWVSTIYCPMHASITNANSLKLLLSVKGTGTGANTNASWITSVEYKVMP